MGRDGWGQERAHGCIPVWGEKKSLGGTRAHERVVAHPIALDARMCASAQAKGAFIRTLIWSSLFYDAPCPQELKILPLHHLVARAANTSCCQTVRKPVIGAGKHISVHRPETASPCRTETTPRWPSTKGVPSGEANPRKSSSAANDQHGNGG